MSDNLNSNIHFDSIVVDSHNDTMMKIIDEETWLPKINIGEDTENHIDIPKFKRGGINVGFFAAFTEGYYNNTERSISRTLALINALYWTESKNEGLFKIASNIEDIKDSLKEDKVVGVPTIEGGYSFDEANTKELLMQYSDLGIKAIAFNWNYSNNLGEGAASTYNDPNETISPSGLTKLGQELVVEMNRLGIIIDVSHMSEKTFWDTINISKSPIIASHSGVYSLRNHRRNLKDDQLEALAKNGGVVGIVLCQAFLVDTDKKPAYIKDFVDHIDYAVKLIGIDHVGIGSDFDGATIPEDIKDSSELYKITEELIKRQYTEEDIEKILGKNILRVIEEVENKADPINKGKDNNLNIIPELNIGEKIKDSYFLTSKIENMNEVKINEEKSRIIVDGIPHKGIYDNKDSTFSLKIQEPLREKFHIVTFEVLYSQDKVKRNTIIFYMDN